MNCIKLNGFVFELELNPKVYKTVEKLFKRQHNNACMTLNPDQECGRKRFGPFHLYQKNNTKNNNQPKSFSLAYTSFGFLTNKKSDFSTCYSSSRSNPEQKS